MRYAFVFLLTAAGFAALAARVGGWAWVLLWPALAFALAGGAYLGVGPRVFGKRFDGEIRLLSRVLLLPFLLFVWGVWHLLRRFERRPALHATLQGFFASTDRAHDGQPPWRHRGRPPRR